MRRSYHLLHGFALKQIFWYLKYFFQPQITVPGFFWLVVPPMSALTLVPTAPRFLLVQRPYLVTPRRVRFNETRATLGAAHNRKA